MVQFGENVWFRKTGEDGGSSFTSRMTHGTFVGHHDRPGRCWVPYQEWRCARQKLDETDTERCLGIDELGRLCGTPWQMVAPDLKLDEESHS